MRTDKPAWLNDEKLSLAQKIEKLKEQFPSIIQELHREFLEKHKGPQERIKARLKTLAGI